MARMLDSELGKDAPLSSLQVVLPGSHDADAPGIPLVSILIPTRHEAKNVEPLVERLSAAFGDSPVEVVFVDDSDDETPQVIEEVGARSSIRVRLIHRTGPERSGGLGGAVVAGMKATEAEWICVMDGDLQHPPELAVELLNKAHQEDLDLALASRFCEGGGRDGLGRLRSLISTSLIKLAQFVFPAKLRGVTDPLTGFFVVRRSAVSIDDLQPNGFKILIEILVKSRAMRVGEAPLNIQERHSGESKASAAEVRRYLFLLARLRADQSQRLFAFGLVGLTGLVINTLAMALLVRPVGLNYLVAAVLATQCSTLWNFTFLERFVFHDRNKGAGLLGRLLGFALVNNAALLLRGPALYVMVTGLGIGYLVANAATLLAMMIARFTAAEAWLWRENTESARTSGHWYDIHGIVSVASDVSLPELEEFASEPVAGVQADIVVTSFARRREELRKSANADSEGRVLRYRELFGPLGFAADIVIRPDGTVNVAASRPLFKSPHVLYTNLVEPILRWTVVQRDYALIHGACMTDGDTAILVTARTDTGKTTTILKTLDHFPVGFMSDDLTLVRPDGTLLMYPKPLTISRHTLHAVKTPLLNKVERTGLFVQSRVHSRGGRKFAHFLIRTHLPVATINMVAQWLIPPPKYSIRRLVPSVVIDKESVLSSMVVIERGPPSERYMEQDEAFEVLMSNTEDAYGFPPYQQIEDFLRIHNGVDLREAEANIVRSALLTAGPSKIVANQTFDWWRELPLKAIQDVPPPEYLMASGTGGIHAPQRSEVDGRSAEGLAAVDLITNAQQSATGLTDTR